MRLYRRILVLVLGFFALSFLCGSLVQKAEAAPPPCTGLQLGAFSKSVTYAVAQREGFFAQEGLTVCYNQVANSVQQFDDFLAGKYDLISTSADNVVNRVINSAKPISIIAGVEQGNQLSLAANTSRGINRIADLRGKPIAVDAPDSGLVFALRKILADNGLNYPQDYSFQIVGGSATRFSYLQAGQTPTGVPVYATMLATPFVQRLTAPATVLAKFEDYFGAYQGGTFAVRHDYAAAHPATVVAYLRAYLKAGNFLRDKHNRAKVIGDVSAELGLTPEISAAVLDAALNKATGENKHAKVNEKGLVNIIQLRKQFNGFTNPPSDKEIKKLAKPAPNGLYDARFWRSAVESLDDDDHDDED